MNAFRYLFISILIFLLQIGCSTIFAASAENRAIDWSSEIITAKGVGAPPEKYYGRPQARPMALRAARLDAMRNLLEIIKGVRIDSTTTVKDYVVASDIIMSKVKEMVKGAKVVEQKYMSDGTIEVTLGLGANLVADCLKLDYRPKQEYYVALPEKKRRNYTPIVPPDLQLMDAEFIDPSGNQALDALEKAQLKITLKNRGPGNSTNVSLVITSIDHVNGLILPQPKTIGSINAGKNVTVEIPIEADKDLIDGMLSLEIQGQEANGFDSDPLIITIPSRVLRKPVLAITDFGISDSNDNAQVEPLEVVEVTARIQNKGQGLAKGVQAQLKFGDNVFLAPDSKRQFELGNLQPNEAKNVRFSFLTNKRILPGKRIPIELKLSEKRIGAQTNAPLNILMKTSTRKVKEITLVAKEEKAIINLQNLPSLSIDVDSNIPVGKKAGKYDIGVIIGNRNYQNPGIPSVEYAHRDLAIFKEYLIRTMGFDPKNILEEKDATKGSFEVLFGTQTNPRGKLYDWVKPRKSRVFVYYVGHGAPDTNTGNPFFLPSDAHIDYIGNTGYAVNLLYANLRQVPAKEIVVILDSCFSGHTPKGFLIKRASPAMLEVNNPVSGLNDGAIMASSESNQLSCWYDEKRHSLFTYFFLKGLRGDADADKNAQITVGEMEGYLSEHVPYMARRLSGRNQTPFVEGRKELVLVRF